MIDDESVPVNLAFPFKFQGTNYANVFVNGNGNLTFGAGDRDFSPTVSEFLAGAPRIAPLWTDLFPGVGLVVATPGANALTIHYVSVPTFFSDRANYFSVRMESSGRVTLSYSGVLASYERPILTGVTGGGGAADPGAVDLSRFFGVVPRAPATYEVFTERAPFDMPFRSLRF